MEKFKVFWDYQKRKDGTIVIEQEELQNMINAAYEAGYSDGVLKESTISPLKVSPTIVPQYPFTEPMCSPIGQNRSETGTNIVFHDDITTAVE